MSGLPERAAASKFPAGHSADSIERDTLASSSEQKPNHTGTTKTSLLSSFFASSFLIFEAHRESDSGEKKPTKSRSYGWTTIVKKVMTGGSMRRLQERILGTCRSNALSSTSDIWLLGVCCKVSSEESPNGADPGNCFASFSEDFSSRIWITYRKGFDAIGDSKYTSDANWGCMIRSSQMLVAQALILHYFGRSWRRSLQKPYVLEYVKILHLFGDSAECALSIHNLLQAGRGYGLAAGSWVGPYAMCRTWETLARISREETGLEKGKESLPMVVYVVSGDEDGERGGAPVVCVDVAARLCSEFSKGEQTWAPILLLVPLVLGLDKVNPRYIPLLWETFTFPQSLGILGGKPGTSTYIIGVQDEKAFYLDPHEVQQAVEIKKDDVEADTSSYHCSTIRHLPLDTIDPSLAIGFYCRDKDDFDDFCSRASELGDRSHGAPLFTVAQFLQPAKPYQHDALSDCLSGACSSGLEDNFGLENFNDGDNNTGEDEWQIL